jgi:hypothetical protein
VNFCKNLIYYIVIFGYYCICTVHFNNVCVIILYWYFVRFYVNNTVFIAIRMHPFCVVIVYSPDNRGTIKTCREKQCTTSNNFLFNEFVFCGGFTLNKLYFVLLFHSLLATACRIKQIGFHQPWFVYCMYRQTTSSFLPQDFHTVLVRRTSRQVQGTVCLCEDLFVPEMKSEENTFFASFLPFCVSHCPEGGDSESLRSIVSITNA